MGHLVTASLGLLLSACAPVKAVGPPAVKEGAVQTEAVDNAVVTLEARCETGDPCVFAGEDLHIVIAITNRAAGTVGFPLAFVQKTGPSIRLTDSRGGDGFWLRTNLAPEILREDFTPIPPGGSVTLKWLIHPGELDVFTRRPLDVIAEISVAPQSRARKTLFLATGALRIRVNR